MQIKREPEAETTEEAIERVRAEIVHRHERVTLYQDKYTHAQWAEFLQGLIADLPQHMEDLHWECPAQEDVSELESQVEETKDRIATLEKALDAATDSLNAIRVLLSQE